MNISFILHKTNGKHNCRLEARAGLIAGSFTVDHLLLTNQPKGHINY